MVLDLKAILNGSVKSLPVSTSLDFSGEDFASEHIFSKPVKVSGAVQNRAEVTEISLNCVVTLSKPCDRCGRLTEKEITVVINRVLVTELAGEENNDDYCLVENEQLDLYDFCLGEILLNLPMKYLCKPDCKGVCPNCGKNLNDSACTCSKKTIDPRLEALAQLLEQQDD